MKKILKINRQIVGLYAVIIFCLSFVLMSAAVMLKPRKVITKPQCCENIILNEETIKKF